MVPKKEWEILIPMCVSKPSLFYYSNMCRTNGTNFSGVCVHVVILLCYFNNQLFGPLAVIHIITPRGKYICGMQADLGADFSCRSDLNRFILGGPRSLHVWGHVWQPFCVITSLISFPVSDVVCSWNLSIF